MRHNTPTAPAWVGVLEAAAEWGVTPWSLADDNKPVLWMMRRDYFRSIQAKISEEKWQKKSRSK